MEPEHSKHDETRIKDMLTRGCNYVDIIEAFPEKTKEWVREEARRIRKKYRIQIDIN